MNVLVKVQTVTYYKGRRTGTGADVGGYSLNFHKHIHTGEGGILVTDDDEIAERLRLIRNHAEAVVGAKGVSDLSNMLGYNFRLGEIECAIGVEQLKKLDGFITSRQKAAERLTTGLAGLSGLRTPIVKPECTHAYYVYPLVLDIDQLGVSRTRIIEALEAEGVAGLAAGYANIHMLPMYQEKIAYGSNGFPWSSDICNREVSYDHGICPVAEELHEKCYMSFAWCLYELDNGELDQIVEAFRKVWHQMGKLK